MTQVRLRECGILGLLGTVLLLVPGMFLSTVWYVVVPVCVAEGLGVRDSLRRSAMLTEGYRWRIFGLLLVSQIIPLMIVYLVIQTGISSIAQMTAVDLLAIIAPISGTFATVAAMVTYYRLRVAKEGIDIEYIVDLFESRRARFPG